MGWKSLGGVRYRATSCEEWHVAEFVILPMFFKVFLIVIMPSSKSVAGVRITIYDDSSQHGTIKLTLLFDVWLLCINILGGNCCLMVLPLFDGFETGFSAGNSLRSRWERIPAICLLKILQSLVKCKIVKEKIQKWGINYEKISFT